MEGISQAIKARCEPRSATANSRACDSAEKHLFTCLETSMNKVLSSHTWVSVYYIKTADRPFQPTSKLYSDIVISTAFCLLPACAPSSAARSARGPPRAARSAHRRPPMSGAAAGAAGTCPRSAAASWTPPPCADRRKASPTSPAAPPCHPEHRCHTLLSAQTGIERGGLTRYQVRVAGVHNRNAT